MESIGTLAGGIAHDFNNILAAILGNVAWRSEDLPADHAARSQPGPDPQAGLRARSLVQQILTFSRRQPNELVGQPLRPVLEETVALLRATLPAWVRLQTVHCPTEPLQVQADATQLQQVVMNLCTNAWHALPEGRGHIEVGLEALSGREAAAALELGDCRPAPAPTCGCATPAAAWSEPGRAHLRPLLHHQAGRATAPGWACRWCTASCAATMGAVRCRARRREAAPSTSTCLRWRQCAGVEGRAAARSTTLPHRGGPARGVCGRRPEVMVLMVQRLLQRAGYRVTACSAPAAAAGPDARCSRRWVTWW
jgi:hypothetical protein